MKVKRKQPGTLMIHRNMEEVGFQNKVQQSSISAAAGHYEKNPINYNEFNFWDDYSTLS